MKSIADAQPWAILSANAELMGDLPPREDRAAPPGTAPTGYAIAAGWRKGLRDVGAGGAHLRYTRARVAHRPSHLATAAESLGRRGT